MTIPARRVVTFHASQKIKIVAGDSAISSIPGIQEHVAASDPRLTQPASPIPSSAAPDPMTAMNFLFRKPRFPIIIETGGELLCARSWAVCDHYRIAKTVSYLLHEELQQRAR